MQIGDTRAFEPLVRRLQDEDVAVCQHAIKALSEIDPAAAVEPIGALLKHEKESMRSTAAQTLGELGDKRAVDLLIETVRNRSESKYVLAPAATALGDLSDPRAIEFLVPLSTSGDYFVREPAQEALSKLGHEPRP
jgi:HEAT repeat protein